MTLSYPGRIEMQNSDVGPIMNHVANRVIDASHIPGISGGVTWDPINASDFENYRQLVNASSVQVVNVADHYVSVLDPVKEMFQAQTLQGDLTHYLIPIDVLAEAVKSGIVVPANAVLTQLAERQQISYGDDDKLKIDFDEVSRMLSNRLFLNSLIRLARVPNGTYPDSSVEASAISSWHLPKELTAMPVFDGFRLTKGAKGRLKVLLEEKKERTDGCPVRKSTYPELGEYALKYAGSEGIESEQLRLQKVSAIVSGARYLSRVFAGIDKKTMLPKVL